MGSCHRSGESDGAPGLLRDDLVRPHHVDVFALQHVAMKDIPPGIAAELRDDSEHIISVNACCGFPAGFAGRGRTRTPHEYEGAYLQSRRIGA